MAWGGAADYLCPMRLKEFLDPEAIDLDLAGGDRDDVYARLVSLLHLPEKAASTVLRQLLRREVLGSTGFGRGVAIPHCRTMAVSRLRLAVGRHRQGVTMPSMDNQPVRVFFLLVAPPQEVSNQYLQVLGKIAQLVHDPDVPPRLAALGSVEDLYALLEDRGV